MGLAQKTAKETAIYSLRPILEKILAIVLVPLYTGYLTPADYGQLAFIAAIGSAFRPISQMGMGTSFWKYYKDPNPQYDNGSIIYVLVVSVFVIGVSIIFFLVFPILNMMKVEYSGQIFIYLFGICALNITDQYLSVLRAEHMASRFLLFSLGASVFRIALNFTFVAVLLMGFKGVIHARAFAYATSGLVGLLFLRSLWENKWDKDLFMEMMQYGMPLLFGNLAAIFMNLTDRFSLKILADSRDLGLFAFAASFGALIRGFFFVPFFHGWNPVRWEVYHRPDSKEVLSRLSRAFVSIVPPIAYVAAAISILAASILSRNESYRVSIQIIPLLTYVGALWGIYYFDLMGILFSGKTKMVPLLLFSSGALNIALNIIMIPPYGYIGAAIATLGSYFVLRTTTAYVSGRLYPLERNIYKETMFLGISALFLGVPILLYDILNPYLISLFVMMIAPVLTVIAASLGILSFDEMVELFRALRLNRAISKLGRRVRRWWH